VDVITPSTPPSSRLRLAAPAKNLCVDVTSGRSLITTSSKVTLNGTFMSTIFTKQTTATLFVAHHVEVNVS